MPIKRAAYKAIRSDSKKRAKNTATKSRIRTLTKQFNACISAKDKEKIKPALTSLISALDKGAQKGILHRRTASRHISRASISASKALKTA